MQRDIRGQRGLYNVLAARPRANGPTNQRREEYRPAQDGDLQDSQGRSYPKPASAIVGRQLVF